MQALHFGAGNIGRGFIGKLLADAGIKVIFADINEQVVDLLNVRREYPVRIMTNAREKTETVRNVSAINAKDTHAVINAICCVDLITTAVGPTVLESLSQKLARGLLSRMEKGESRPLNVIACENMVRASRFLKEKTFEHISAGEHEKILAQTGFVDSVVDRIIPPAKSDLDEPLMVTVELFSEWIVDRTQFAGNLPSIPGMETTTDLIAFVERKLFTLNTGHAATAYLGKRKGIALIKEAINNDDIYKIVKNVMQESGAVLIRRYGFDPAKHLRYIEKILDRFSNPFLSDDVDRVGRQPIRKLGPGERLVKPLNGTLEYQLPNDNLATAVAAALHYRNPQDEQAVALARLIATDGPEQALIQFCAIDDAVLGKKILECYHAFS